MEPHPLQVMCMIFNGDFGGVLAIHGLPLFLPSSSFPWSGDDNPGGGLARRTRRAEHRVVNGRNKEGEKSAVISDYR